MSKSLPKWLCLAEGAVRTLRVFEHGCDAGLLTARKTSGSECLLGAAFTLLAAGVMRIDEAFGQSLMHRDVVQVPEGVLQFLQAGHETLASARGFLAEECAGKKFRGVAELLGLNAHLMSTLWVEHVQLRPHFHNLLPASPQLVDGSRHNRLFSQRTREIVGTARPAASLDPGRRVENKIAKARGFDGRAGAGKGILASLLKLPRKQRRSWSIRLAVRDRPHNPLDEHVKFARRTQFLSDPSELGLHLLRLRIKKHVAKQRDCRPQAPQSNPHLVQSFCVAAERGSLVGDELAQARPGDRLKCGLPTVGWRKRNRCCLHRLSRPAGDESVAVLGLALDRKLNWHFLGPERPARRLLVRWQCDPGLFKRGRLYHGNSPLRRASAG